MKRRDFFKASAIGVITPKSIIKASKINIPKNKPVILSTWNFGLKANIEAEKSLRNGGNAMDAAEKGAMNAESDEENNSVGIGGAPDEKGNVTLDACVMDSSGNAGSVAFLQNIKHPVSVARKVMEDTKHVMLVGEGAREFAVSNGFKEIDLLTKKSKKEWKTKLMKYVRELFGNEIKDPIWIEKYYWKQGLSYWKPNSNSKKVSEEIIQPLKSNGNKIPLFICGSNYSMITAWSEGGLLSVDNLLKKI